MQIQYPVRNVPVELFHLLQYLQTFENEKVLELITTFFRKGVHGRLNVNVKLIER